MQTGIIAGVLIAFSKEVYDYFSPENTSDGLDAIVTIVGSILGYILVIEFYKVLNV